MPLTDTAICNAKPTQKPYKLFDERGLYLGFPGRREVVAAQMPVQRQGKAAVLGRLYNSGGVGDSDEGFAQPADASLLNFSGSSSVNVSGFYVWPALSGGYHPL